MSIGEGNEGVAIIGASGALGFGLAVRLGSAGHRIVIGSREPERAQDAAARARLVASEGTFEGTSNEQAAASAGIVFVSVPFRSQVETLKSLAPVLGDGQILVDATVPLAVAVGGRATRTISVWQGSAAQQAQELAPEGVRVVSALHTVSADLLSQPGRALDEDVLVCGDRKTDKQRVMALIDSVAGLRSVDCGRLEMSRITESVTAMLIGINSRYKTHAGIRITGVA